MRARAAGFAAAALTPGPSCRRFHDTLALQFLSVEKMDHGKFPFLFDYCFSCSVTFSI
jgi:hypothetical protein